MVGVRVATSDGVVVGVRVATRDGEAVGVWLGTRVGVAEGFFVDVGVTEDVGVAIIPAGSIPDSRMRTPPPAVPAASKSGLPGYSPRPVIAYCVVAELSLDQEVPPSPLSYGEPSNKAYMVSA